MRDNVYFPNLNGLRFIAAMMVIVHHIEQILFLTGVNNFWSLEPIKMIGKLGVVLFFVLSGFLITYLLLEEKNQFGTISIKDFYLRRIFRIWPLYYLIILAGLFIFPLFDFFSLPILNYPNWDDFGVVAGLFIFFLPNLALAMFPPVAYISQTWSIGVEEQFYFIWPFLIKVFKRIEIVLLAVILIILSIKLGLIYLKRIHDSRTIVILNTFWDNFNIDCMALGGLAAFLLYSRHRILWLFYNKSVQYLTYGAIILLILFGVKFPHINYTVYAALFAVLILNLAGNAECVINLETAGLNYLGKISYGLYMFHPLVIFLTLKHIPNILENRSAVYMVCIVGTIILAIVSYELFEKRILAIKTKYTRVISGVSSKNL